MTPGDRVVQLYPQALGATLVAFYGMHGLQWDYSLIPATTRDDNTITLAYSKTWPRVDLRYLWPVLCPAAPYNPQRWRRNRNSTCLTSDTILLTWLCLTQVDRWRHSVSDVVVNMSPLKRLLESISNILPVFIRQWEIQTHWVYTGWLFLILKLSSWKKEWTSLIAFLNWEFLTGYHLAIINRTRAFLKFKMAAKQRHTFSTLVLKIGTIFLTAALRETEATPRSAEQLPQ
jgi:hypothetical protein